MQETGEFRAFWDDFISAEDDEHAHGLPNHVPSPDGGAGEVLLSQLRRAVIGHASRVTTPYGTKTVMYADYTASGRALAPVEDFIRHKVRGCAVGEPVHIIEQ